MKKVLQFPTKSGRPRHPSLPQTHETIGFTLDNFGRCVAVDASWQAVTGLTPEECLAGKWIDLIHPDDAVPYVRKFHAALASGRSMRNSCRMRSTFGVYFRVKVAIVPFLDHQNRITHWSGVLTYNPAEISLPASAASNQ